MTNELTKLHRDYFKRIAFHLPDTTFTVVVGRPAEVLGDESFSWKLLDQEYLPKEDVTRATYVHQENNQTSFISVLLGDGTDEWEWGHGIILTTTAQISDDRFLELIASVERAVSGYNVPWSHM